MPFITAGDPSPDFTVPMMHEMVKAGVGLTPENRKTEGLILIHSIRDNLCYASMNVTADGWIENKRKRNAFAEKQIQEFLLFY